MVLRDFAGINAHCTFGLRAEWVALTLRDLQGWAENGGLGPRQVQSLAVWLKTTGLDRSGAPTALYRLFQGSWPESWLAWEILWANVCLRWPTARWYVMACGLGAWSTPALKAALQAAAPRLAERTVNNAILELAGLLERTPVGDELRQGRVERVGAGRRVARAGLPHPHPVALAHAAQQLLLGAGRAELYLWEEHPWPWTIYGAQLDDAATALATGPFPWLVLDDHALRCTGSMEALRDAALF